MGENLGQSLQLAQIGAQALALPFSVQQQQAGVQSDREVLRQLGIPEAQLEQVAPNAPLSGFLGRDPITRTIGTTGAVLSGLLGAPIPAPRPNLGALISARQLEHLRTQREGLEEAAKLALQPDRRADQLAAALFRAGRPESALKVLGVGAASGSPSMSKAFAAEVEQVTGRVFDIQNPEDNALFQARQREWLQEQAAARGLGGLTAEASPIADAVAQLDAERKARERIRLGAPDVVETEARAGAAKAGATALATDFAKFQPVVSNARRTLTVMRGAVNRQLTAETFRARQGKRLGVFLAQQSPAAARMLATRMGLPEPTAQDFADWRLIQGFSATLGQLARTIGRESGGRLSDQDILRFQPFVFTLGSAGSDAEGTLQAIDTLLEASADPRQTEADLQVLLETLIGGLEAERAARAAGAGGEAERAPAAPTGQDDPAVDDLLRSLPAGSRLLSVD